MMSWLPRSHHTSINTTWKQTLNMFHLSTNPVINTEKNTTFPFITSSDEVFPTYLTVFDLSGRQKMGRFTCKCGPDADMLPLELRQKKKPHFDHIFMDCAVSDGAPILVKKNIPLVFPVYILQVSELENAAQPVMETDIQTVFRFLFR